MSAEENVFELVNELEEEMNNVCENNRGLYNLKIRNLLK
jgi:hypothetical protein